MIQLLSERSLLNTSGGILEPRASRQVNYLEEVIPAPVFGGWEGMKGGAEGAIQRIFGLTSWCGGFNRWLGGFKHSSCEKGVQAPFLELVIVLLCHQQG